MGAKGRKSAHRGLDRHGHKLSSAHNKGRRPWFKRLSLGSANDIAAEELKHIPNDRLVEAHRRAGHRIAESLWVVLPPATGRRPPRDLRCTHAPAGMTSSLCPITSSRLCCAR
jgi:hypothetical protein